MYRTASLFIALILVAISTAAFSSERVRAIPTPDGGSPQHAIATADGTVHLLYEKDNEPFYVKSTDGGATFGAPLRLVDDASKKPELEFNVWDMALGKGGVVYAVLGNNAWKLKLPKDQWGLFLTTLEPNAKAFTPLRNINHEPSEGFSIAADAKGNVALSWLKGKVFFALSRDGGKTFSPGAELNATYNPCPCCTTALTYGNDGKLALLYREQSNDDRDIYMVLVANDGRQTRQKVSATPWKINACPMTYFNVNPTKDGYSAAWPTKGEIYFARFGADGKVLPPGEIKTNGKSGMRSGVLTLSNPAGETLVTWNSNGKVNWQVYDSKGAPAGEPGSADARGKGVAAVLTKEGGFLLFQ
jgi:hypothetical protein